MLRDSLKNGTITVTQLTLTQCLNWDVQVKEKLLYSKLKKISRPLLACSAKWTFASIAPLVLVCGPNAAAVTYYVTSTGSDNNLGTSQALSWRTIAKANVSLMPGDTVFIGAGTYGDQIRPVRSGTGPAARINYTAMGDGYVTLTAIGSTSKGSAEDVGAIALGGRSFVLVDGVKQLIRALPGQRAYIALGNFNNAQYNVINSVYLDGSTQTAKGSHVFLFNYLYGIEAESKYNVLSNSYLAGRIGSNTQYTEDTIHVAANAHHNLIDGNTILNARHVVLKVGTTTSSSPHHNVIRNNIIRNSEHTALELYSNPGPYSNVIEGNYISASGGKPVEPSTTNPGMALEYSGSESIFRYNVITKGGAADNDNESLGGLVMSVGGGGSRQTLYNRFYNNTIVKHSGVPLGVLDFGTVPNLTIGQGAFINNFIYGAGSPKTGNLLVLYWDGNQATNDYFIRNVFGNPLGNQQDKIIRTKIGEFSVGDATNKFRKSIDPSFESLSRLANSFDSQPGFVDYLGDNFKLAVSSKHIDAGAPLTQVTAADTGTGTTLVVEDTRFFQDGNGVPSVAGDWIAVGDVANIVQISNVNHANHSISLTKPIPRKKGDAVWLFARSNGERVLYGTGPEIGAYEAVDGTVLTPARLESPNKLRAKLK